MSTENPISDTHDCGAEAAAYVLGALEPDEARAFRRHLESCAVCRDEVAVLQQVVEALPMAAPQQAAPRGLRRRVLRAVRMQPAPGPEARERRRPARAHSSRRWLPAPALLALGVVLAALAIAGGFKLSSGGSSAPRVIQARVMGSSGSAELRVSGGHAELVVRHLQPPPAGRIYEVWLGRAQRPPSPTSALFSVTAGGAGAVDVPGSLHGVSVVMVTQEPAGGSRVPTHPPVIVAKLT
jgi:anti-sigma-K factor RskA